MILDTIFLLIGLPVAQLLLKRYVGDLGDVVGKTLADTARKKIGERGLQREAKFRFENLGERIAKQLLPSFEREEKAGQLNVEAVAREIGETFQGRLSSEFFLSEDLDPARLAAELRRVRPLPEKMFSEPERAFYDRSLDEAVRYVVGLASRLPRFDEAHAAESLTRLRRLEDDVDEVLQTTRRIEQIVAGGVGDPGAARFEGDYRKAVLRRLDYVEIFGADLPPEARLHKLSVAYVSLDLQGAATDEEQTEALPVDAVLDGLRPGAGRLLVRGVAGGGKSTLFRWIAIEAAKPENSHRWSRTGKALGLASPGDLDLTRSNWRRRIPFLVRLRDCEDGQLPSPDDFPELIARGIGRPPEAWVRNVEGRGLVLLDGVDEVPNLHRDTLRSEIKALIEAYPDNYFLLSTRPAAAPPGWLADLGFVEAEINPMERPDIEQFVAQWYEAVAKGLEASGKPTVGLRELAKDLLDQLRDNPSIERLASNPLLCAMICALHRERASKLPEGVAELCDALSVMLLHRRERESGLDLGEFPEEYRRLTYEHKRAIVSRLAYQMVLNGVSTLRDGDIDTHIARELRQFPGFATVDPQAVRRGLVERSGVLREARPGHVDFLHNTLKEYLASSLFVEAGDTGLLARNAFDAGWQPVLLFAMATRKEDFATELVRLILGETGGEAADDARYASAPWRDRALFALRCRAVAFKLAPELDARLETIARRLFPPRTMGDAEVLATMGNAAVPYLRRRANMKVAEAAASVRALRRIGTREAQKCLAAYQEQERRLTVLSELTQAGEPLMLPCVMDILVRGEALPFRIARRVTTLPSFTTPGQVISIDLRDTKVSDISPLQGLTQLQSLNLRDTKVSDISPLQGLTQLQKLFLSGARVSDISPLQGLTQLQDLDLRGTQVSDISPLRGLTQLRKLYLNGTQVSDISPLRGLTQLQISGSRTQSN
jgi:hypothetical protein